MQTPGAKTGTRLRYIARVNRRPPMEAGSTPSEPAIKDSSMRGLEHHYGRRGFLLLVAGGLTSLVWAGPVSRLLSPLTAAGSQALGNLLPVGGWRIYTITGTMPVFDPATWRLDIGGLVKRPQSLSYADLKRLPKAEQVSTFHCVTGWSVNNVHWAGVRFQHLLDLAHPLPEATAIRFVSLEVSMMSDRLIAGFAECELPPNRSRALDLLNDGGAFFALISEGTLWAVNRTHVRTVRPVD